MKIVARQKLLLYAINFINCLYLWSTKVQKVLTDTPNNGWNYI